jgi:hypothetical protein
MSSHVHRFLLLTFLLASAATAQAIAPPPSVEKIPESWGVNIHFTDPQPGEMKELSAAGFRWIRMDFGWGGIERRAKGEYDFSAYDRLMDQISAHHIRPIFILDYSNRFYDGGESPRTDEGRAAFAAWAAASVRHFKGRGILWEMYNEPNIGFWKPHPNVEEYAKLALAVGKAIRAAEPGETYIGPGSSTIDLPFIEHCCKVGCLEYWSAVSVHPYRQSDPETVSAEYRKLRLLIARYAPPGRNIPIISSEWGYSSGWQRFDERRQAMYLPRELLVDVLNDVPVSIWYDWHEDGTNPREPEHHFGIVRHAAHPDADTLYEPKPAYLAMKALATSLAGFRFSKRLWTGAAEDYVLLFDKGEDVRLAAWTSRQERHKVRIAASDGPFDVTDASGHARGAIDSRNGQIDLSLDNSVQYFAPQRPNDLLRVAAAWERLPIEMRVHAPDGVRVVAKLRNPLSAPIRVQSDPISKPKALAPGAEMVVERSYLVTRSPEPKIALLRLGGFSLTQATDLLVDNPLTATLLPAIDNTIRVIFNNPSGDPTSGSVELRDGTETNGTLTMHLELAKGETRAVRTFHKLGGFQAPRHLWIGLPDHLTTILSTDLPNTLPIGGFASLMTDDALHHAYRLVPDGDAKIASEQSLSLGTPSANLLAPDAKTLRITYQFAAGWKFLRLAPEADALRAIKGQPTEMSIWVYGDGQGNHARMRFIDATGQTFQSDGGQITWTDWREIRFPLTGPSLSHWGGANDGTIHYPIRLDTLFLLDGNRQKTGGTIELTEPAMIYGK